MLAKLDSGLLDFARCLVLLLHDADNGSLVAEDLVLDTQFLFIRLAHAGFLKMLEDSHFEKAFSSDGIVNFLEVCLREVQIDRLVGLWIFFRLEVERYGLELSDGAQLYRRNQRVAIDFLPQFHLTVPAVLGAFETWLHSVAQSTNHLTVQVCTAIFDDRVSATTCLGHLGHQIHVAA